MKNLSVSFAPPLALPATVGCQMSRKQSNDVKHSDSDKAREGDEGEETIKGPRRNVDVHM